MILIVICLCIASILKFLAILNTITWIGIHGSRYRKGASRRWPLTEDAAASLLDDCSAGHFPFGVKDYLLRRHIRKMRRDTMSRRIWRGLLGIVQKIFEFQYLAILLSAFLIVGARTPKSIMLAPRGVFAIGGAIAGILVMADAIFLGVLAFFSYAVLGSYGVIFYNNELGRGGPRSSLAPRSRRGEDGNSIITEIYAYAGMLITAYVVICATTYFVSMQMGGFASLNDKVGPGLIEVSRLFNSFYWTMLLAVGSGDAGPTSILAKIITMIGTITAVSLFVIVLAGLAGITVATPERHRSPHRNHGKVSGARGNLRISVRKNRPGRRYSSRTLNNYELFRRKKRYSTANDRRTARIHRTPANTASSPHLDTSRHGEEAGSITLASYGLITPRFNV